MPRQPKKKKIKIWTEPCIACGRNGQIEITKKTHRTMMSEDDFINTIMKSMLGSGHIISSRTFSWCPVCGGRGEMMMCEQGGWSKKSKE